LENVGLSEEEAAMQRITFPKGLALGLTIFLLLPSNISYSQDHHSYKSWNFPDRYIRHRDSLAYVEKIIDIPASKDADFVEVPGLAGRCQSFESRNFPGFYLRHQNFRLKLSKITDEKLFKEDATFCVRRGLAEGNALSFESFNFPKYYIRHRDFELWVGQEDGSDLFKKDATFIQTQPVEPAQKVD
jgi:Alpha-L-arabinofuranosidase B (ABFB) domain